MDTTACLKAFLKKRPEGLEHLRMLVSPSVGVLRAWKDGALPVGINLLRLRYFLKTAGYQPDELICLRPGVYALGEAVVFGNLGFDAIIKATDMPIGNHDNVYKILCRGGKVGKHREQIFLSLTKDLEATIVQNKATLERALGLSEQAVFVSPSIASAVEAVVAVQELLAVFVLDGATRQDREVLRATLKKSGVSIHDLYETVTSLLSEGSLQQQQKLKERYTQ